LGPLRVSGADTDPIANPDLRARTLASVGSAGKRPSGEINTMIAIPAALGNLGVVVDPSVAAGGYTAAIAGAQTAQDACDRLNAAGFSAAVQDESLVIDGGKATASPYEGVNKIGDHFYLWCIQDQSGELSHCVARGPHGSCPPRH
jgi:hypothetical protein